MVLVAGARGIANAPARTKKPRPGKGLLAHVGHQSHEASPLDGILDRALESRAVPTAFAAEKLALTGAKLLQGRHVFVINKSGPGTPLLGAKPATIFPTTTKFLPHHRRDKPFWGQTFLAQKGYGREPGLVRQSPSQDEARYCRPVTSPQQVRTWQVALGQEIWRFFYHFDGFLFDCSSGAHDNTPHQPAPFKEDG